MYYPIAFSARFLSLLCNCLLLLTIRKSIFIDPVSGWHIVSNKKKGKPCHANSGHYREASSMTTSALLLQKRYLVFFCFKQGEKTIIQAYFIELGVVLKEKLQQENFGLWQQALKQQHWFSPRASLSHTKTDDKYNFTGIIVLRATWWLGLQKSHKWQSWDTDHTARICVDKTLQYRPLWGDCNIGEIIRIILSFPLGKQATAHEIKEIMLICYIKRLLKSVFKDLLFYSLGASLCFSCYREWKYPIYKFATVAEMKPLFVGGKGTEVLAEGIFLLFAVFIFLAATWSSSRVLNDGINVSGEIASKSRWSEQSWNLITFLLSSNTYSQLCTTYYKNTQWAKLWFQQRK